MNKVCIVGNVGRDPEVRNFEGGFVASFSVAVKRPTREDQTDWFEVKAFARQTQNGMFGPGKFVAEFIKKGRQVAVDGRLEVEEWTDQAGNQRKGIKINADNVQGLGSKDQGNGQQAGAQTAAQPAPQQYVNSYPQNGQPAQQYNGANQQMNYGHGQMQNVPQQGFVPQPQPIMQGAPAGYQQPAQAPGLFAGMTSDAFPQ